MALGTFVFEFATAGIGKIDGLAGADFVLFDMEHTGWSFETVDELVGATRSAGAAPFVRVPVAQRSYVSRALDIGAMGIMVPMVPGRRQAEDLVAWMKYPPLGARGASFGLRRDEYVADDITVIMASANAESLLITQIETVEGLDNVEDIAAVYGVDVLWVGQFDLTNSMGIPGQFDHRQFLEAIERVSAAAKRHGKAAGYMARSVDEARAMIERGFHCIAYSQDVELYSEALRDGLSLIRGNSTGVEDGADGPDRARSDV
jgi:2-keto-3-deoxy-L-rhamnonate aldolase RhmA